VNTSKEISGAFEDERIRYRGCDKSSCKMFIVINEALLAVTNASGELGKDAYTYAKGIYQVMSY
jgi:hypothetical protein